MSDEPDNRNPLVLPIRDELGRVKKGGGSLNPGGRPNALRDLAASIRSRSPELIARLFKIALQGKEGNPTTVRAAEILLERGYGKAPVQLMDEDGNKLRAAVIILPGDGSEDGED